MNKSDCSTRAHVHGSASPDDSPEKVSVTFGSVVRAELYVLVVWILVGIAALALFGIAGLIVTFSIFLLLMALFFGVRVYRGHTFECAILGALSTVLRITEAF